MLDSRYRSFFFLIFAISGFTGLIYESLWTHYQKLFLGHAAYAQTLVLAIFMGGMAVGSWICSKRSFRWNNLLLIYAVTEGVIGFVAVVFHEIFRGTVSVSYAVILPQFATPVMASTFKWILSALLILPQTVLLGMTFPLMSAGILRAFPDTPGRSISLLYFANSIGAAIGVLMSGFVFIRLVGLPGTMRIAGLINVLIAVVVWILVKEHPPLLHTQEGPEARSRLSADKWYWILLLASMVTGIASFIYEIGWIRMLSLVLGSSTHAFELMLSAFIFGLAFGGLWIQRRIDRIENPVHFLIKVQAVMGLLALSTIFLYGHLFGPMQWIVKTLPKNDVGYAVFNLSSNAIALIIMVPTTFCAGMTLPLITYALLKRGHGEKSIGAVYAANTVGAIIGIFSSVHLGMPLLGLKGLITAGASFDLALAVALLFIVATNSAQIRRAIIVTGTCLAVVALNTAFVTPDPYKMASGVYRTAYLESPRNARLLYHKDGKTSTVSVFLNNAGGMSIRTNGKADAMIQMNPAVIESPDEHTMTLLAILPMALKPHAKTVANIGFGSGLTTNTLLLNDLLERVDTIEIEPAMIEGARNFGTRVQSAYSDPRSWIYIDDAKTFFSVRNKKFDIIISEPSNPWVSGVATLFSQEFYRMVSRNLKENGLFCQWLQIYEINTELVVSVLKALSSSFPDYVIYAANDNDLIIMATNGDSMPEMNPWVLDDPKISKALKRIRIMNDQDLQLRKVGNRDVLGPYLQTFSIRANSDYFPVLDQNAVRSRFLQEGAAEILRYTHVPLPSLEMLTGSRYPWNHTDITPYRFLPVSTKAFMAMAFRDYFSSGTFGDEYHNVPARAKALTSELKAIASKKCRQPSDHRMLFNHMFDVIGIGTIPYLRPNELDNLWDILEKGACFRTMTLDEREWIALFKAVGRRDAAAMAEISRDILQKKDRLKPAAIRYLVAAGMLGSIVNGDRTQSALLWEQYRHIIAAEKKKELLIDILAAQSKGQAK
jgi:spermidine synthase